MNNFTTEEKSLGASESEINQEEIDLVEGCKCGVCGEGLICEDHLPTQPHRVSVCGECV